MQIVNVIYNLQGYGEKHDSIDLSVFAETPCRSHFTVMQSNITLGEYSEKRILDYSFLIILKVYMSAELLIIEKSPALAGTVELAGAKNAVLVIMASLLLTKGTSILRRVPVSDDVFAMIKLLRSCGAQVDFDEQAQELRVTTTHIDNFKADPEVMRKMRASILIMGPLLARLGKAEVALPGGCLLGARPIDFHIKAFAKMGALITQEEERLVATCPELQAGTFILSYPSVGATENIMMAATRACGITKIVNAALEPEVMDLIAVLQKMGAKITIVAPATLIIEGVRELHAIEHDILLDRLEAGTLLLAAAITGGTLTLPDAPGFALEVFLEKLSEMGHTISTGKDGLGITLTATSYPKAVSFKTMPYPGFPTDLQAPMMAALCLASGVSVVEETVFENRLMHVRELQKMGAQIEVSGITATIKGVDSLFGAAVIASDIRAAAGLVLAGLVAEGQTQMTGVHHIKRGYSAIDKKLMHLGGSISYKTL